MRMSFDFTLSNNIKFKTIALLDDSINYNMIILFSLLGNHYKSW